MRFTLVSLVAFFGLSVGASGAVFALAALAGLSRLDTMAAVILSLTVCAVFTRRRRSRASPSRWPGARLMAVYGQLREAIALPAALVPAALRLAGSIFQNRNTILVLSRARYVVDLDYAAVPSTDLVEQSYRDSAEELRRFIERWERLEADKKDIASEEEVIEMYKEAPGM